LNRDLSPILYSITLFLEEPWDQEGHKIPSGKNENYFFSMSFQIGEQMNANDFHKRHQEAELKKLDNEIERIEIQKRKLSLDCKEVENRLNKKWWHIQSAGLVQAVIGGIVAGILVWGFALDHFLKVNELTTKRQEALKEDAKQLIKDKNELADMLEGSEFQKNVIEEDRKRLKKKEKEYLQVLAQLSEQNKELKESQSQSTLQLRDLQAKLDNIRKQYTEFAKKQETLLKSKKEYQELADKAQQEQKALETQLTLLTEEKAKSDVRAQQIAQQIETISFKNEGKSFPLVASVKDENRARQFAKKIEDKENIRYQPEVYEAGNGWYVVTLGGHLSKKDAQARVNYAIDYNIAADAFVYQWAPGESYG
jgi:myosin heavy subunit